MNEMATNDESDSKLLLIAMFAVYESGSTVTLEVFWALLQ